MWSSCARVPSLPESLKNAVLARSYCENTSNETLSEFIHVDISILWTIAWQFFKIRMTFIARLK